MLSLLAISEVIAGALSQVQSSVLASLSSRYESNEQLIMIDQSLGDLWGIWPY